MSLPKSFKFLFLATALCVVTLAQQSPLYAQEKYTAGKDYEIISTPVRTSDPNKIEVTEVFWYGCGHCDNFRPVFARWKRTVSDDVKVQHSPAIWRNSMKTHAKIYYTAKVLGLEDEIHPKVFDAIHNKKQRMFNESEIYQLFKPFDISREKFDKTFDSFGVNSMVQQADSRARSYGIQGTPEIVVNGKYRISGSMTGSMPKMLEVAEFLIERERASNEY